LSRAVIKQNVSTETCLECWRKPKKEKKEERNQCAKKQNGPKWINRKKEKRKRGKRNKEK
jgi:hypothetical protein